MQFSRQPQPGYANHKSSFHSSSFHRSHSSHRPYHARLTQELVCTGLGSSTFLVGSAVTVAVFVTVFVLKTLVVSLQPNQPGVWHVEVGVGGEAVGFGPDDTDVLVLGEDVGSLQPNQPGVLQLCEDDVVVGVVVVVVVVVAVIVTVAVFCFVLPVA
jgi:hypothetical protein